MLLGPIHLPQPIRRPRAAQYGAEVQEALPNAWTAANGICGKRLVPFLPELIPTLERHGHLSLSDAVRQQVLSLSPATADRLLKPLRQPRGLTTTKPGRLRKQHIPVRTFTEWTDAQPGFLEADLVAQWIGGSQRSPSICEEQIHEFACLSARQSRLYWPHRLPIVDGLTHRFIDRLRVRRGRFVDGNVYEANAIFAEDIVTPCELHILALPTDCPYPQPTDLVRAKTGG